MRKNDSREEYKDWGTGEPKEFGIETAIEKDKKIIVEIGSDGYPIAVSPNKKVYANERYLSYDVDPGAITIAKEESQKIGRNSKHYNALYGNGEKLRLRSETVDEIIINNVLGSPEYGNNKEGVIKLLKEATRILKKGGKISITECYTPEWLDILKNESLLQKIGLRLEGLIQGDVKKIIEEFDRRVIGNFVDSNSFKVILVKTHDKNE